MQRLEEGDNDGGLDAEDSEMTEEVDWHDFMVVEQIELYNDVEMTEQQNAQQFNAEQKAQKSSALIQQQVKQHMEENEELKSMPDPSAINVSQQAGAENSANQNT